MEDIGGRKAAGHNCLPHLKCPAEAEGCGGRVEGGALSLLETERSVCTDHLKDEEEEEGRARVGGGKGNLNMQKTPFSIPSAAFSAKTLLLFSEDRGGGGGRKEEEKEKRILFCLLPPTYRSIDGPVNTIP